MKKIGLVVVAVAVVVGLAVPSRAGGVLDLGGLLPHGYFHPGFNQIASGLFFPIAGAENQQSAGFITPAIEHDAKDGALLIPGVSYNLLNLGYKGSVSNLHDFLHGSLVAGPSVQLGEPTKKALRMVCAFALPNWDVQWGALKAVLSPGSDSVYADVGIYGGLPMNQLTDPTHIRPSVDLAATLVKKFGAPAK